MHFSTVDKTVLINSLLRHCIQALFIVVLASIVGLIFNHFRPNGLTVFNRTVSLSLEDDLNRTFAELSLNEALEEYNSGESLFIDARGHDSYISGHIKGARNIPANRFNDFFENALRDITTDRKIIIYCNNFNCDLAEEVANKLFLKNFDNIRILKEGWEKWFEAFLPIEEG